MWIRVTLVALLGLLLAGSAWAQSGGLELTLLSADPAEVGSQFPASISINVLNTSSRIRKIKAEALAAEGWGVLVLPGELELEAGANKVVFVTVNAPTTQAAGTYEIVTRFTPLDADMAAAELTAGVRINPVESISILATDGDTGVFSSDEPVKMGFQLVNMGNSTTTASLVVDVMPQWEYTVDTVSVSLNPGGKTDLVVELTPPDDLGFVTTVRLSLKAITSTTSEEEPAARISTTVNVLPGRESRNRSSKRGPSVVQASDISIVV